MYHAFFIYPKFFDVGKINLKRTHEHSNFIHQLPGFFGTCALVTDKRQFVLNQGMVNNMNFQLFHFQFNKVLVRVQRELLTQFGYHGNSFGLGGRIIWLLQS